MAKGKYQRWQQPENLSKLTNWASKGLEDKEIAANMGISRSTFYAWLLAHADISDAIKEGREMRDVEVENALFRCAVGKIEEVTEIVEEKKELRDGILVTVSQHIRRTTRKLPPQYAPGMFIAKNKLGYVDNPEVNVKVEAAPVFYFNREDAEASAS